MIKTIARHGSTMRLLALLLLGAWMAAMGPTRRNSVVASVMATDVVDGGACVWHGGNCAESVSLILYQNGGEGEGVEFTLSHEACRNPADLGAVLSGVMPEGYCEGFKNNRDGNEFCTARTAIGTRVSSCADISPFGTLTLFLVPSGRLFMWPTLEIGHTAEVPHVQAPGSPFPVKVTTLSHSPRVFDLEYFFTSEEANALIENALAIPDEEHRLKQSTTGDDKQINKQRTSETAFDSTSPAAQDIIQRAFDLVGISPYDSTWGDGLQILRYNQSKAYIPHLDWMDQLPPEHDGDSSGKGTNRFATVLLYLTDVAEGGQTVFPKAYPPLGPRVPLEDALREADESGHTSMFAKNSWERKMVGQCRSRLAVAPARLRAVLFYSQLPDGRPDPMSLHGGCPVLNGTKWAANLWIWNGPRFGYSKRAEDGTMVSDTPPSIHATFEAADGVDGAELFYESQPWGLLEPGQPLHINTYAGHKWVVRHHGRIIKTWVVPAEPASQRFILQPDDLMQASPLSMTGEIS